MSKYTIIVEDSQLDQLVLHALDGLSAIPQVQLTRNGGTFKVRLQSNGNGGATEKISHPVKAFTDSPDQVRGGDKGDLATRFETAYQQWKQETRYSSSGHEIFGHPAYKKIGSCSHCAEQ